MKDQAITDGVEEAFAYWLSQHPISVPELIESGVKAAFESRAVFACDVALQHERDRFRDALLLIEGQNVPCKTQLKDMVATIRRIAREALDMPTGD